jgi:hypothetical protein
MSTITINNLRELEELLIKDSSFLTLGIPSPEKSQEFYIFRGVKDESYKLEATLEREVRDLFDNAWRQNIECIEAELINRCQSEILQRRGMLKTQYSWFREDWFEQDTFWVLSVMQHFGHITRLLDFTSDVWQALYFAMEKTTKPNKPEPEYAAIYRFKCKNEDHDNQNGNKLPKNTTGKSPTNISGFLGSIIGNKPNDNRFAKRTPEQLFEWQNGQQQYGWDQPYYMNARMQRQKGFLMYNVTCPHELEGFQ